MYILQNHKLSYISTRHLKSNFLFQISGVSPIYFAYTYHRSRTVGLANTFPTNNLNYAIIYYGTILYCFFFYPYNRYTGVCTRVCTHSTCRTCRVTFTYNEYGYLSSVVSESTPTIMYRVIWTVRSTTKYILSKFIFFGGIKCAFLICNLFF